MKLEVFINGKRTLMTVRELKDALLEHIGPWNGWVSIAGDGTVTIKEIDGDVKTTVVYNNRQLAIEEKREKFRKLYRQMRIAHSQISIMSENGVMERMKTYRALRNFCNRWVVPTIHDSGGSMMFYRTGCTYQSNAYKPWYSFQKWMQVN
jgi:hypothetical protein